ncbi:MAG: thioredoxin fold domain-containing protein [Saccharospirillaceae bacterium]|nr:thioredoxin fold domain-containing protein [Saccharospirillaceae bacterium]
MKYQHLCIILLSTFSLLFSPIVMSQTLIDIDLTSPDKTKKELKQTKSIILKKLQSIRPDLEFNKVLSTSINNIFEVTYKDGSLFTTQHADFLFTGDILKVEPYGLINMNEQKKSSSTAKTLNDIKKDDLITYQAENQKAEIYVFTDISCGYCVKLHKQMDELNALGITVNYLAYPRAGLDSDAYEYLVTAWCDDNPQNMLTQMKLGKGFNTNSCKNPVASQYKLGQSLNIQGTPAIFLSNGAKVGGYVDAKVLAKFALAE